jgi:hypothetical protein
MTAVAASKASIGERAVSELKEFLVVAAYLFVCFSALAYLKYAILQAQDVTFAPFGFAAAKALICAKFVSIGHALHLGERHKTRALIWPTLYRSLVFLVLLLVLNIAEEVAVGLIHHRAVMESISEFGGGTIQQLIATSFIVFLVLVPFFAFRSLGEVVGEQNLIRVFLHSRHSDEAAQP